MMLYRSRLRKYIKKNKIKVRIKINRGNKKITQTIR